MAGWEFGEAMHRWRDRVAPEAAGLPSGGMRRAAGLRREELAMLAGISVDYVTRLEQGRATNPSDQVVEALARALRLSEVERAHLFRLAGLAVPGPDLMPTHLTPSVQRLLDRLVDTPVAVSDPSWTLLVANPAYSALMGDMSGLRGNERNSVWRNFIGPRNRTRHTPESLRALETVQVADLRAASAKYPDDPRLRRLIAELRVSSDRFAELWDAGAVGGQVAGRKTIDHPQVGTITLDCDILTVNTGTDLRIMILTAEPGTEDAERLALAMVLGTQALVDQ
ncbi:MAG TPA: helix-turn-helix transcriptional regulator [Pseudonocardiaceae bacterium]|jgi:transcriptional regulator with XRE-family HTH domain|nr:helix-turn-helix transcriptional regulator [Pseudonocardiaceae bacterium]